MTTTTTAANGRGMTPWRPGRMPMTLEQWVNKTAEGTEDPYSHLDRDAEDREAINDLLGRRE